MMVVAQGVALAATLFYAGADAVAVIREGGTPVAPGDVAAYGAITGLISLAAAWWLRRRAPGSDLVDAEAQQWRADAILSAVMVAGALAGFGLVATGRAGLADYVDPVLVLVACAVLVPTPLCLLRSGTVELLEGEPSAEISDAVRATVEEVRRRFGLDEPIVRLHKLGREALRRGRLRRRAGRVGRQRGGRRPSGRRRRPRARRAGRLGVRGAHDGPGAGGVTETVTPELPASRRAVDRCGIPPSDLRAHQRRDLRAEQFDRRITER